MKHQIALLGLTVSASLAYSAYSIAAETPLQEGTYFAPMASYINEVNKTQLDDGFGGIISVGHRNGALAYEAGALFSSISTRDKSASLLGGGIRTLLFPLKSLPGLYASVGFSGIEIQDYPTLVGDSFSTIAVDSGLGYIFPIQVGHYEFGIRAEGLYRHGHRETRRNSARLDLDAPNNFNDVLINVGLQLPLGTKDAPPPPEPVATVVPPETPADTDGDGVSDTPDKCPGTPAGDKVDAAGCTLPLPCRSPAPGERITLVGCRTGDVILLRGVNFEFNQSTLEPNAETVLNAIAAELVADQSMQIEVVGHTDNAGDRAYNQRLSVRRAASVVDQLAVAGVAHNRMQAIGLGEQEPAVENDTDAGREQNRRVEIRIVSDEERKAPASDASSPKTAEPSGIDPTPAQ